MRKLFLPLIIVALLVVPVLADDTQLATRDPGWIGIMTRINMQDPRLPNMITDALSPYIPDWMRQSDAGALPRGVYFVDMEPLSLPGPTGSWYTFQTNTSSGQGIYPIAGSIYDLVGEGKWDYTIRLLNGVTNTGSIYKTDHIILYSGFGYSDFNLTTGGKWFNTTVSQPRIIPLGATPFWWSPCYNLNTTQNAILAFDGTKHLVMENLAVPPSQNPIVYFHIEGPNQIKGKVFAADYSAIVNATQRMSEGPGMDLITTAQRIGTALLGLMTTLFILFDWFVLKAGFVTFLLVIEVGMLAVYVNQSKDFFQFIQKFIKGNRSLFEFMAKFVFFFMNFMMAIITLFARALAGAAGLVIALIGSIL